MALNLNQVTVTARLTRDAETKHTPSGMAITTLGLAISNPRKDRDGAWHDDTVFIDCTCFDKTAEKAATLAKGQKVCIEARLKMDKWDDKTTGQKRTKHLLSALSVKPFEEARKGDSGDSGRTHAGNYEPKPGPQASDALFGEVDEDVPF